VLAFEVQVEDREYDGDSPEDVLVRLPEGVLSAVCIGCTTTREAHQHLMELASQMLTINESYIEEIEGVGTVMPALLDDPQVKAGLAQARQRALEARAQLQALSELEHEIEGE
jgi:hypothetical protein